MSVAVAVEDSHYTDEPIADVANMGNKFGEALVRARNAFHRGITKSVDFRIKQLKQLLKLLDENQDVLAEAMQQDLSKPKFESLLMEVEYVRNDIRGAIGCIKTWMKPQYTEKSLILFFDKSFIHNEPYGVALIIGAWNYPVQLTLSPLVGAIAAGNCVILKPSEVSPSTAKVLEELLPQYLDKECYHVVTGGVSETTELLKEKFDYIFYTGNPGVGKIIREAANKHLTPVTLELGGKSPVYLDNNIDMDIATKRIIWGKFINAGQTCVSPDYVLCAPGVEKPFLEAFKTNLKKFYTENPEKSPDFGRIVNNRHFQRLSKVIKSGTTAIGGELIEEDNYIAPTVLINVKPTDPIMQEEIFGPILPILSIGSPQEAIEFIKSREKPLSLYVFSTDSKVIGLFMNSTSSGSLCVNDTVVHLSIDALPFGGVGQSGIGRYHGKYSFETFSHQKAVLVRNFNPVAERIGSPRYPPFSDKKLKYLNNLLKKRTSILPDGTGYVFVFILGFIAAVIVKLIYNAATAS